MYLREKKKLAINILKRKNITTLKKTTEAFLYNYYYYYSSLSLVLLAPNSLLIWEWADFSKLAGRDGNVEHILYVHS